MGSTINGDKRSIPASGEEMVYFPVRGGMNNGHNTKRTRRRDPDQDRTPTWRQAWLQYCSETSLHGLKQVAEQQPFMLRRLVWLLLVLIGGALFTSQMISSVVYYRSWPVSVNIKINYNDTIRFPAVTICNLNAFRTTVASAQGRYFLISELYDKNRVKAVDLSGYNASHLTLDELFLSASHDKHDMIVSCEWDNHECGPEDFQTTLTDFGVCYTFNSENSSGPVRYAWQTGTNGGLRLRLNAEQYEYMQGPNEGAGMKLLVHEQSELPLVRDFGVAIPPGFHALVAVKVIEVTKYVKICEMALQVLVKGRRQFLDLTFETLSRWRFQAYTKDRVRNQRSPYGKCDDSTEPDYFDHYTKTICQVDLFEKYVDKECGCRAIHMPAKPDGLPPVCTLHQYQTCYLQAEKAFQEANTTHNHCPVPCTKITYDSSVSYAMTSTFDSDTLLRSNLTPQLTQPFLKARETSQRVDQQIVEVDRAFISEFTDAENVLSDALSDILSALSRTREPLHKTMSELFYRVKFHLDRGLNELDYAMAHDFVRGWEVMEERCLRHVAANFYDVSNTFQHVINGMNQSLGMGGEQQEAAWLLVDSMLAGRMFLVSRAKDNITRAHTAYKSGIPLLTYKATIDRRYDSAYIAAGLLRERAENQDMYFAKLMRSVDMMSASLESMRNIGKTFVETGHFDQDAFQKAEKQYISGCKMFNYRLFQYRERIIKSPVAIVKEKVEAFLRANRSLAVSYDHLLLTIHSVESSILLMQGEYAFTIQKLVADSQEYLRNPSLRKTPLAEQITSKEMYEVARKLDVFFPEVRERLRALSDSWLQLQIDVESIWTMMLSEHYLDEFHEMMTADYLDFKANTSDASKDFYLRIFGFMLQTPIPDLSVRDPDDLLYMLNADFHNMSLSEKTLSIQEQFLQFVNDTASTARLRGADDLFVKAFRQYRQMLAAFLKGSRIDLDFYGKNFMRLDVFMQELSYEEIIQQRAYDVTSLLSDIGGSLGLFVGASVLSIFEFFDVVLHTGVRRRCR